MSIPMNGIQTNPFIVLHELIKNDKSDIHIVDFHCETTSEKNALFLEFASKVSAIFGTHTHIQTADDRIYKNTAYVGDVGFTGGSNGIIGAEPETILKMFNGETNRFKLSPSLSPYQLNGIIVEFDKKSNKPINLERIFIREND
jgi:calcineurin-like phosphoesterase